MGLRFLDAMACTTNFNRQAFSLGCVRDESLPEFGPLFPVWLNEVNGGQFASNTPAMEDRTLSVHAHRADADAVIREQRQNGYVLKERTKPTIPAQDGFVRLVFVPEESLPGTKRSRRRSLPASFQWLLRLLTAKL